MAIVTQPGIESDWSALAGDPEIATEAMSLWRKAGEKSGCTPRDYVEEAS